MVAGRLSLSADGLVLNFVPDNALSVGRSYSVSLSGGIADVTGNVLSRFFSFTTGLSEDTTPPTVEDISPPDGLDNVPSNVRVTVQFDEPVSALDVSVQAAVTDLLMEIQRKNKTTLLFISHDLSIVRYLSDRVMVMYLGHVVEMGSTDQVFQPPYHPYTEALLSAVPIADTSIEKQHIVLEGDIPSAMNPPSGCPFQTRCRWKDQVSGGLCDKEVPPVRQLAEGHQVKCHLSDEILSRMEPVIKIAAE